MRIYKPDTAELASQAPLRSPQIPLRWVSTMINRHTLRHEEGNVVQIHAGNTGGCLIRTPVHPREAGS